MRALAPAAAALACTSSCGRRLAAQRHAPRLPRAHALLTARAKPAGARDDGSELLADVCASLGVRFELTNDEEAPLWEDDYQEIVSEAEDVWGREAAAVDDTPLAPPPWLAAPAPADAAADAPDDAPGALRSAYSPAQGFRALSAAELAAMLSSATPPLVVDVSEGNGEGNSFITRTAAASAAAVAGTLRIPLPQLSAAVRAGLLDGGRSRTVVCVCDTGAAAAQAAVRLRRVFGFPDVAALSSGAPP